jgi:hypothetical protein
MYMRRETDPRAIFFMPSGHEDNTNRLGSPLLHEVHGVPLGIIWSGPGPGLSLT